MTSSTPIKRKTGFQSDMDDIQPLNPDVADRAETILSPTYEAPAETGADLTEKAIGMLEGPAMLLADPMSLIQKLIYRGKEERIDELATKTETDNKYRKGSNSYSAAGSVLDGMRNIKADDITKKKEELLRNCLLYTSPSPRDPH